MIFPSKEEFIKNPNQVIYQEIISDIETPITASLKLKSNNEPFFLLESVENGSNKGRYSIIGLDPDLYFRANEEYAEISSDGVNYKRSNKDILTTLREIVKESELELPDSLPPMSSGLIGYMSYDAIRLIEDIPNSNPDNLNIPLSLFLRPQIMIVFDSVKSSFYIVVTIRDNISAEEKYELALSKINLILTKLDSRIDNEKKAGHDIEFKSHITKEEYFQMVEKCKEYIYAGDAFQVVPSQRFDADFNLPPFAFYRSLRHTNPSPFLFYLDFTEFQLIGSSPEILTRVKNGIVTIRPLAGTRKRGKDKAEDDALAKELLADEKEISEHLMLIDLSRNDVGRVSKAGSVKVTEEMIIEYYSHVMHISSNVDGQIRDDLDNIDALFSALPVGTVSGAPKVRAMEIIDEVEKERRSFYAGCVGYFSANGDLDTCITLRTALIKDNKIYLQAGGGVVANSDPEFEFQESCNKAKALMVAAKNTKNFL